jgi:DNA polymerase I-like protein with 3'-5' exonuclease and polymerase domains
MEQLFRRRKLLKNGAEGKTSVLPTTLTLHTGPEFVGEWVEYAALDAEAAFYLRHTLFRFLAIQKSGAWPTLPNMQVFYETQWRPFGLILTDMEKAGITVSKTHLNNIRETAIQELKSSKDKFLDFLKTFQDGTIDNFNLNSVQQLQQLLYAPFSRQNV